jgi:hypothetical protein
VVFFFFPSFFYFSKVVYYYNLYNLFYHKSYIINVFIIKSYIINVIIININKLYKDNIVLLLMELSTYTKGDKSDMFDYVNHQFLHLQGNKKKYTKSNFKSVWKEDNMAFILMVALANSEAVYDKMNDSFKKWISDGYEWEETLLTHKPVPYAKHRRLLHWRQESIDELEKKLEDVEKGNGYVSEEKYDADIQAAKEHFRQCNHSITDQMIKYKNEAIFLRDKMEAMAKTNSILLEEKDKYISLLEKEAVKDD